MWILFALGCIALYVAYRCGWEDGWQKGYGICFDTWFDADKGNSNGSQHNTGS